MEAVLTRAWTDRDKWVKTFVVETFLHLHESEQTEIEKKKSVLQKPSSMHMKLLIYLF